MFAAAILARNLRVDMGLSVEAGGVCEVGHLIAQRLAAAQAGADFQYVVFWNKLIYCHGIDPICKELLTTESARLDQASLWLDGFSTDRPGFDVGFGFHDNLLVVEILSLWSNTLVLGGTCHSRP